MTKDVEESGIDQILTGNKNLLVTFGGINKGMGIPVFEFYKTIADIRCDKVLIRDLHQTWYQRGVDSKINTLQKLVAELEKIISNSKYESICFVGNSMGGFAAILFGILLEIDNVIAFAPQSFVSKRLRFWYRDRRWPQQIKNINKKEIHEQKILDLNRLAINSHVIKPKINIFYSKNHRLDRIHSERLKNLNNVTLHPLQEGGHGVVKLLKERGQLTKIIHQVFSEQN